ncbi:MAG TPA: hypothetical protein VE130_16435 [Nitrososphaeraceae archaeon]|nr:hypothetical protein [Nitrososphaeraceae archaeon]
MSGEDDLSWTRNTLENITEDVISMVRDELRSDTKLIYAKGFPMGIVTKMRPRESLHGGPTPRLASGSKIRL